MSIKYRLFCHIFTFSPARRAAGQMNDAVVFRRHLPVGEHNTGQAAAVSQAFLRLNEPFPFLYITYRASRRCFPNIPATKKPPHIVAFRRFGNETSRSSLSAFPTGQAAAVSQTFLRLNEPFPFLYITYRASRRCFPSIPATKKRFRCVCRSPGASRPSGKGGAHPPKNAGARARRRRRTHPPPQA